MSRILSIFLDLIQWMDPRWRVFVTFLATVTTVCLLLFAFLPLLLSLMALLLRLLRKGILGLTDFCLKSWGRLVIRWRKKAGRYPQFLVSVEDFIVRVIASLTRFFDRLIQWKPPYGAIGVRVALISCILLVLLTVALWVIPGTGTILTTYFMDWEGEYIIYGERPAAVFTVNSIQESRAPQIYYKLSKDSANFRKTPDGEIITTLTDSDLLLRYLGKTTDKWLNVEYFEDNRKVQGWIHETMVSRWRAGTKSLEYLKPDNTIRISAPEVPLFDCRFLGFERAEDGTIHLILKGK